MYEQLDKLKENSFLTNRLESRAVANSVSQKKSKGKQGFGFVDNRPETVAQRKILSQIMASPSQPIQCVEIPSVEYSDLDLKTELQYNKTTYQLDNVTNLNIGRYVDEWLRNAIDSDKRFSPSKQTTAQTIATSYRAEHSGGGGGWHVPKNQDVLNVVGGTTYEFHNDANGYLNFLAPINGKPACPNAGGTWNFTIHDPTNGNRLINTDKPLNSGSRSQHFREANIIREGANPPANGNSSPPGFTWHHHAEMGRMQLINREVHAAFSHKGGFSVWGS
ncbi:HNH endonuclease [Desulfoluna spongiiphila]|uniref:HNH endonuclease n=1 Tax=Desulfoluna spongiiphila TaxID=419481 RepID=UPI00125251C5|nr:HNH endonuclease [Desulfoluna spongiiphila]VVS95104.1 whh domain-containing protein [Desulfoluna spongiiphila]